MAGVFISYRKADAGGYAGRLYDALIARFGEDRAFMDVAMPPGVEFAEHIAHALGECDVLVAMIGERWASVRDKSGRRRLEDANDLVRVEIETALTRPDVVVIPVLLDRAELPSEEVLPKPLAGLARRQAVPLRGDRWRDDVESLLSALEAHVTSTSHDPRTGPPLARWRPIDQRALQDLPRLSITTLGGAGLGKTTYLYAAYAALSAGIVGYFLSATTPQAHQELIDGWAAVVSRGRLPPPTGETPSLYLLAFWDRSIPLLAVEWLDYRGGAIVDRMTQPDTELLMRRLGASDSVHVIIDGAYLASGVHPGNLQDVRRKTKSNRITHYLYRAAETRAELDLPPIVLVITKADLVLAGSAGGSDPTERTCEDVRQLLPVAFEPGVTTLVCPVTLGDIGRAQNSQIDRTRVRPRAVSEPLIFSISRFLNSASGTTARDEQRVRELVDHLADAQLYVGGTRVQFSASR